MAGFFMFPRIMVDLLRHVGQGDTMARATVPIGTRVFGKIQGQLRGTEAWAKQTPSKHWSTQEKRDEPAWSHQLGSQVGKMVEAKIAEQVRDAVPEYLATAEFGLSVVDGKMLQRLRVHNSEASVFSEVDVFAQLQQGIQEAKLHSHEENAQAYLGAAMAGLRRCIDLIQANIPPQKAHNNIPMSPADTSVSFADEDNLAQEDNPFSNLGKFQ